MKSIIGTVISDRYRIIKLLGEGADKQVYLSEDLRLFGSRRAMAVMVDSITDSEKQKIAALAFEREAEMLTRLKHPRIPQIFDRFSEGNAHYLVMEFVEGETLQAKLQRVPGNRLPEAEAVSIAVKVLAVLDYLHKQTPPVIFRDLKPDNVILRPDGELKLIDFGIARFFRPTGSNIGRGTVGYAAPEQYQGAIDARSDIYALGATLHHMLTGRDPAQHPFDFPPTAKLVSNCDPNLAACIDSALERDPAKRPQSAAEFRDRIRINRSVPSSGSTASRSAGEGSSSSAVKSDTRTAIIADTTCIYCQAAIAAEARFCTRCGRSNPSAAAVSSPENAPARQGSDAGGVQKQIHSSRGTAEQQGYAGSWRYAVGAVVTVAVLILGVIIIRQFRIDRAAPSLAGKGTSDSTHFTWAPPTDPLAKGVLITSIPFGSDNVSILKDDKAGEDVAYFGATEIVRDFEVSIDEVLPTIDSPMVLILDTYNGAHMPGSSSRGRVYLVRRDGAPDAFDVVDFGPEKSVKYSGGPEDDYTLEVIETVGLKTNRDAAYDTLVAHRGYYSFVRKKYEPFLDDFARFAGERGVKENPGAFFGNPALRAKYLARAGYTDEQLGSLRDRIGLGDLDIVAGRYATLCGCQFHGCSDASGAIAIDAEDGRVYTLTEEGGTLSWLPPSISGDYKALIKGSLLGSTCFFRNTETSEDVVSPYRTTDDNGTEWNYTYEKLLEPTVKDNF